MSTTKEKIMAQRGAFESPESAWWHRHLVGPVELEAILSENATMRDCLRMIANLRGPNGERLYEGACQKIAQDILSNAKLTHKGGNDDE